MLKVSVTQTPVRSTEIVDKNWSVCDLPEMINIGKRPSSLAAIADRVSDDTPYTHAMKEFIDHLTFISQRATYSGGPISIPPSAFADEPSELSTAALNAHLGGMAEFLAGLSDAPVPDWCNKDRFFLDDPCVVAPGLMSAEMIISQTPGAFKRRNLFCGRVLRDYVAKMTR